VIVAGGTNGAPRRTRVAGTLAFFVFAAAMLTYFPRVPHNFSFDNNIYIHIVAKY
jgi:hypothetical protein